jgi:hypothetical protein
VLPGHWQLPGALLCMAPIWELLPNAASSRQSMAVHGSPWQSMDTLNSTCLAWTLDSLDDFRLSPMVWRLTFLMRPSARSWGGSLHNGFECLRLTSQVFTMRVNWAGSAPGSALVPLLWWVWGQWLDLGLQHGPYSGDFKLRDRSAMKHLNFGWRRCLCNLTLLLSQL